MKRNFLLFSFALFFIELSAQTFSLITNSNQLDVNSKYIFASFSPGESGDNNVYLVGKQNGTKREMFKTDIIGVLDTDGETYKIPNTLSLADIEISYFEFNKKSSALWKLIDFNAKDSGDNMYYLTRESSTSTGIVLGDGSDASSDWQIDISSDGRASIYRTGVNGQLRVSYKYGTLGIYTSYQNNLYIFRYEGEYTPDPVLNVSRSSITFYVPKGESQEENLNISGKFLKGDITVEISGNGFSVDKNSILKSDADNASLVVTYTGDTNSTGTLTLKSDGCEDVVVALSAEIIEESPDFKFSSSEGDAYFTGVSSTYGTFPTLLYKGVNVEAGAVEYSSSDDMIATVDAETGKVTAHGVGDCTIVAKHRANGLKTSYTLNVTDKMYVRLKNVGDITSGEYVLIGQKADDSFGVFDICNYKNETSSDKFFVYQKDFSSLQDVLWRDYPIVNIDVDSKDTLKYCTISSPSNVYLGYYNNTVGVNVDTVSSNNAISFFLEGELEALRLTSDERYFVPHAGTQYKWKMYAPKSGSVVQIYNNGYCLYLYRQALHVSSVTGRKLVLAGEWNSDVFSSIMDGCPEAAWIDLTSVTGMLDDVTLPSRENCIFVVPTNSGKVKDIPNVVSGGTANNIVLTDGESPFCAYESFTATNVSYNRNFSGTTSTICLPFSCDIPEGVDVYEMTAFNDGHTVEFAKAASIEAYKPYIIRTTGTAFLNLTSGNSGYTFPAEPEEMSVSYDALSFCGTMSRQELRSDEFTKYYGYSSGELQYVGVGKVGYVNPFRAYFVERSNDDLKTVDIVLYDVPASIESTEVGRAGFVDVYSIDGRLIKASVEEEKATDGLDKGIYIIGKRKVLVK